MWFLCYSLQVIISQELAASSCWGLVKGLHV
jgi:hypothetical protein